MKFSAIEGVPNLLQLSSDVLNKIIIYYLEEHENNPLKFMLVNKKWYVAAMSHPFIRLATIIFKLNHAPPYDTSDRANFRGIQHLEGMHASPKDCRRLLEIDTELKCFSRLIHTQGFILIEYYRPFINLLKWNDLEESSFHLDKLDSRLTRLIKDINFIWKKFVSAKEKYEDQSYWKKITKEANWNSLYNVTIEGRPLITNSIKIKAACIARNHGIQITDIAYAECLIGLNSEVLQYLNETFKKNESLVLQAIKQDACTLKMAHQSLQENIPFLLKAIKKNSKVLTCILNTRNNDFILELVKQSDSIFKNNKEFILESCGKNIHILAHVNPQLLLDRSFLLCAILINYNSYMYADDKFKTEFKFLLDSVIVNFRVLKHAKECFRENRKFILYCCQLDPKALKFAHPSLTSDRAFITDAMQIDITTLVYSEESIRNDEIFILDKLKAGPKIIAHIGEKLAENEEFLLKALKVNWTVFEFFKRRFKEDILFIQQAAAINGAILQWVEGYTLDKDPIIISSANKTKEFLDWQINIQKKVAQDKAFKELLKQRSTTTYYSESFDMEYGSMDMDLLLEKEWSQRYRYDLEYRKHPYQNNHY